MGRKRRRRRRGRVRGLVDFGLGWDKEGEGEGVMEGGVMLAFVCLLLIVHCLRWKRYQACVYIDLLTYLHASYTVGFVLLHAEVHDFKILTDDFE